MTPATMRRPGSGVVTLFFVALVAAAFLNALMFALKAVNPLITSDSWHFIDTVVRKAAEGNFSVGDLFLKRYGFDHSQPLRKLILLFHYRFFALDFGVETAVALVMAFVNLCLFWAVAMAVRLQDGRGASLRLALFAALAATYLSLNSSVVFSWPLLTLNYTTHTFLLLYVLAFWWCLRAPTGARLAALFGMALVVNVVADDTGIVTTLALVLAASLVALRQKMPKRGAVCAAASVAGYVSYKLLYAAVAASSGPGPAVQSEFDAVRLVAGLADHVDGVFQWVSIPLVSSVAHRVQLQQILGEDTAAVEVGIAILMFAAHAWFWWRAFRGRINVASFMAVALMLLFYGLVAGMVVVRVGTYGSAYLWQLRYALIYEWNMVALLLMALGQLGLSGTPGVESTPVDDAGRSRLATAGRAVAATAAGALLLLQLPLSAYSWKGVRYQNAYMQTMAFQMGALADNPEVLPGRCVPLLVVCKFKPERRAEIFRFLSTRQLNVFSPAFQARYHLYPRADTGPR